MRHRSLLHLSFSILVCASAPTVENAQATERSRPLDLSLDLHKIVGATVKDADGAELSVTRLDLLLSEIALKRPDGSWLESRDWQAFFSATQPSRPATLTGVPEGEFTAVRFMVGLPPKVNHADPNSFEPGHALHPSNGLHWGWAGGYIFLAIEGHCQNSGWSFHLGNDEFTALVELPCTLDTRTLGTLQLTLDPAKLLAGISLKRDGSSTHSRPGDALAAKLKANTSQAFRISNLSTDRFQALPVSKTAQKQTGTPFPLNLSARLPQVKLPQDNVPTIEGVALGKRLFEDKRLSLDNTLSCASCHDAGAAFSDKRALSLGVNKAVGSRNAMPIFNLAWQSEFFWDGRAKSLRTQALMPIQDAHEMAETLPQVEKKLRADASYASAFKAAFGDSTITADRVGLALEQFMLTLVSQDSKFDRAARKEVELSAEEKHGLQLFITEYDPARGLRGADCFHCHGGNLFTSGQFINNGLQPMNGDTGRAKVTGSEADLHKFKTPSLRNVAVTAPYMHDGRFATLEEVVEHYNSGVQRSATLDPNLAKHPASGLNLTAEEKRALVAFLRTLTDERFINAPARVAER